MPDQEINNLEGAKVESQVNVNKAEGSIYIVTNVSQPKEGKYKEHDTPNKTGRESEQFDLNKYLGELSSDPSLAYNFSIADIPEELLQNAWESRILLLDCPEGALLHAATYAFIDYFEKKYNKEFEKKHIYGENLNRETSESIEIGLFSSGKIIENQLIVLDVIKGNLTQNFLNSLSGKHVVKDIVKDVFTKRNNLLLVKINGSEGTEEVLEDLKDCIWKIPFLTYYLEKHKCQDQEETILRQQQQGHWEIDPYKFHKELQNYVPKGKIKARCEELDSNFSEEDLEKRRDQEKETMRLILEKEKKPLRRYMIFLVAFFKDITDDEFDSMLYAAVKDDKKLCKAYKEGYKNLLQDCHIQRVSSNEEDYIDMVLEFKNPDYREQAIRYFFLEDFQFVRTQCNAFLKQGFLLQKGPSYRAYRGLIGLIGRISKASTGYAFKLLKYLITAIVSENASIDLSIPEHIINNIIAKGYHDSESEYKTLIENNGIAGTVNIIIIRSIGYGILAEVIQEISYHDHLAQDLKQFYHILIANRQHDAAFKIIQIMRHSTKVDKLDWIRQLIDNGETKIKAEAFAHLVKISPQNPSLLYEHLNSIYEWLPTRSDPKSFSHANKYALRFILEYSNYTYWLLKNTSTDYFGQYPSFYPLFALLEDHTLATHDWLKKLTDWFCHPQIEFAFNDGSEEAEITKKKYYFEIAHMLENWYAILHGLSREVEHQENLDLFDKILTHFIPIAKNELVIYQSLVFIWTKKPSYYEEKIKQAIMDGKAGQTLLQQKTTEQEKMEFAARRYLLIEKFIPAVKRELDKQATNL